MAAAGLSPFGGRPTQPALFSWGLRPQTPLGGSRWLEVGRAAAGCPRWLGEGDGGQAGVLAINGGLWLLLPCELTVLLGHFVDVSKELSYKHDGALRSAAIDRRDTVVSIVPEGPYLIYPWLHRGRY